jgi:phosphatidylserine/phosphatidylglycerophosphate/cardiolipin synthase-like enzyme
MHKVRVYGIVRNASGDPDLPADLHRYVHAKVFIFDDEFAIIGSTNGARRSFNCDSEVVVGLSDVATRDKVNLGVVRRLRMRLWAEHFRIGRTMQNWWLFADGAASGPYAWSKFASRGHVDTYDAIRTTTNQYLAARGHLPGHASQRQWDLALDPFSPGPR